MRLSTIWTVETMSTMDRFRLTKIWSKMKLVAYLKIAVNQLEK